MEIAWGGALCPASGATPHTSPSPAMAPARAWMPAAWWPSSFETRITGGEGGPLGDMVESIIRSDELARLPRPAPLVDEGRHERGPARLVRCPQALAGVRVEVLVEQDQVAPVRIVLELATVPVDGPAAGGVAGEDADQAVRHLLRHLPEAAPVVVVPPHPHLHVGSEG